VSDVVMFHSALGLRPAIWSLAELLRTDGHNVTTLDLYEGRVFDDLDEGVAERDRIGIPELIARSHAAVAGLPADLVYIGISLGTAPAQLLATTRPGAKGVALIQGAVPLEMIGVDTWPEGLACQLHTSGDDPWHEQPPVDELFATVPAELLDHHDYPNVGHLFLDPEWPAHDADATGRLVAALRGWLSDR
jgi:dienelactone hydrolase